jgi:hypothetical protein
LPLADGSQLSGNKFINAGLKPNSNTGEGENYRFLSGGLPRREFNSSPVKIDRRGFYVRSLT